jgi:hypothetical protein
MEQARIPLELSADPLRPIHRDIFQLDITREPAERVRIWPGAGDNRIEVLSVDESLGQLVLFVREPRRSFEDRVRIRGGRVTREQVEAFVREGAGGRVLRPRGSSWLVERYTDPAERRYLIGFDQRHLFAAQLPAGDTVREAHETLKPAEVREADRRWPGATVRQGEWFFVPTSSSEEDGVRRQLALHPFVRRPRPARLGDGEPHWVEELVRIPVEPSSEGGERFRDFARGSVHHRDHRTVRFDRWRRVHLNTAIRRPGQRARGFHWID